MEDIYNFFMQMNWWQWLSFGVALLAFELMFPGLFMLWFGISALVVALFTFVIHIHGAFPVILFLVMGIASSILGVKYQKNKKKQLVNNLESNFIGRKIVLKSAICDGIGREKIDNSYWTIKGPNLKAGETVNIVAVAGNSFIIEKVTNA